MKTIILSLGLLFSVIFSSYSQKLSGYVLFSDDHSPVEYGSVILKELPDSTFISGGITYEGGEYAFDAVKPGTYVLTASYLGCTESHVNIDVKNGSEVQYADTIFLKKSENNIDEVKVSGDFIRGEELVDRTVYKIPPEVVSSSMDGYEVLRKLPSVQVDFNNNITLDGSSNFIIQVDGKKRDKEFLARLSPDAIQSVEIIHNPSGKYDGSIDGVINVVLKKEARTGISGNITMQVKPFNRFFMFGNAGLDYGLKKVTFYASGYSFYQSLASITNSQYHYSGSQVTDSLINANGSGDLKASTAAFNTGFDYYIDDKHDLSLNYSYKPTVVNNDQANQGLIYVDNIQAYEQEYINSNDMNSGESNISLFFRKKFKKPIQELTFENTVYWFNSDDENDYSSLLYPRDNTDQTDSVSYTEDVVEKRKYFKSKLDYIQPVGVSMRMETGYEFYYQDMSFDTDYSNSVLNNDYTYAEARNAMYLNWIWNQKKISVMASMREEYSDISINDSTKTDYFTFLPSATLQYKINSNQNIKLTYNRRISRPHISQLNPFEKLNSYQYISSGNPYLEPEKKDKIELKYSINFKKKFISPYVYYTVFSDKISTVNTLDEVSDSETTILKTYPDNVLSGNQKGIGLNSMLWYLKLDGNIYKGHYNAFNSDYTQIKARDYYSYNTTVAAIWQPLKDTLTVYGFVMYRGVSYAAQSKTYSNPLYGIAGQYKLKNHTFAVNWLLPGTKNFNYSRVVTETDNLYSEVKSSFDVQYFIQFTYRYTFHKGKSIKKVGHKSQVESDTKSSGIPN